MSHADVPHRDPPHESASRAPDPSDLRDQRIEQLLISGLDRYFAGELERAIQVWSRVFFLDRGHPRARAYIDRARGAIAERQREAEARSHRVESGAFTLAEVEAALAARSPEIVDAVASADAFAGRSASPVASVAALARAPRSLDAPAPVAVPSEPASRAAGGPSRSRTVTHVCLVVLAALLLFGAGYVVAARDRLAEWWTPSGRPALSVPAMAPEQPPRGTATR